MKPEIIVSDKTFRFKQDSSSGTSGMRGS